MTCSEARGAFSRLRDADLAPQEERRLNAHLDACPGCRQAWCEWRAPFDALGSLPQPPGVDLTTAVMERLALERRDPGLASMFRPLSVSRPYLLSSLVTASLLWLCAAAPLLSRLDRAPSLPRVAFSRLADRGSDLAALAPAASVVPPRERRGGLPHDPLSAMGEGTVFLETVVGPTGRVSRVRLLGGDASLPVDLLEALSHQRFEPGRYRGRAVAVAVYRLFSRLEVVASPV